MPRAKIKFNSRAFRQILVGPGVASVVNREAHRMASRAGEGITAHGIVGGFGGGRAVAFATTTAKTPEQAADQRERLESAAHGG